VKPHIVLASLLASLLLSTLVFGKEKLVPMEASPLPSFALEDAWGEPFQNKDFTNKWSVVTIGFASCPDVCPFILTNLKVVSNQLAQISRDNIAVVFVSVDPERDKTILADYVDHFGHNVTGITGEDSELQKLAQGIGAYYELEPPDSSGHYNVRHSAFAVVVSPKGEVVARLSPPLPALETAKFIANLMRSPG
jgi:protein SCO1/2